MEVHPIHHDSGTSVPLKAMASSVLHYSLDSGRRTVQVTEEPSSRMPISTQKQIVGYITMVLRDLSEHSGLRVRMDKVVRGRMNRTLQLEQMRRKWVKSV